MKKSFAFLLALVVCCICSVPYTFWAYDYQGPEVELIELINKERAENGSAPINMDWEMTRLARYRSEEMRQHGLFSHESLVYGSPAQTLERFHISYCLVGSNIAMGHETAQEVFEAWRVSQSHYDNIVYGEYTGAGVGLSVDDNGVYYWTLLLVG